MRITARADYAVRAMAEIAAAPGGPRTAEALALSQGIPARSLEDVLADLRRAGLVRSQRGAEGGYRLARPAGEIAVADVIRAVEGPLADVHGTPPERLSYAGPALHLREVWVAARAALRGVLEAVTVGDVVAGTLPAPLRHLLEDPDAWARRAPGTGDHESSSTRGPGHPAR